MEEQNLYEYVKKKICRMIYEDIYRDGDMIPPERKLSEELGVSRVTVRKALKLLEEEKIIERIQGSGTRVALQYGARKGKMDIITLVAPAQNAFFSQFMDAFQTEAEKMDSLVLFKQKTKNQSLEKCLFQIYEKDLKNVVLWLEDMELSQDALRKLRGLGMNLVLFDTTCQSMYADAVCLDNEAAIQHLYQKLQQKGCERIGFAGWDELRVRSVRAREQEYLKLAENPRLSRISWGYRKDPEHIPDEVMEEHLRMLSECDGVIYSVVELGIPFERKARALGMFHHAVAIDVLPGADELGLATIEQDFQKMAATIFDCLKRQNQEESQWKAYVYKVKGRE